MHTVVQLSSAKCKMWIRHTFRNELHRW